MSGMIAMLPPSLCLSLSLSLLSLFSLFVSLSVCLSLSLSLSVFFPNCVLYISSSAFHVHFSILPYSSCSSFFLISFSSFFNPCLSQLLFLRSRSMASLFRSLVSDSLLQPFLSLCLSCQH